MFNTEKLSIEQFNGIKQKLTKILDDARLVGEANQDNPDFNMVEFLKQTIEQYLFYQNSIFNYDLSDIPFEAWKDFNFITLEDLREDGLDIAVDINIDFSKTRANLDFSLIYLHGKGNFKSCNVKNIQNFYYISEDSFDEQVIKDNSDVFLSSSFSGDFKDKFYSNKLKIDDFVDLSSEQLIEIKHNKCYEFSKVYDETNFLGLERCIELYKNFPNDYYEVIENINNVHPYSPDSNQYYSMLFNCELKDLKNISLKYFRETILKTYTKFHIDEIPSRLINENRDIFLPQLDKNIINERYNNNEIDEQEMERFLDLSNHYYNRRLSLDDFYNNLEMFNDVDLSSFFSDFDLNFMFDILGKDNFKYIIENHKE